MKEAAPGDVFAALFAAHQIGDHWVQTSAQSAGKGKPGWPGRRACAAHVASLTGTKIVALAGLHLAGYRVRPGRAAAALAADAASHYLADRRSLDPPAGLAALASRLGKREFWMFGLPRPGRDDNPSLGTGGYALDQAFHLGCLWVAAVAAAG